MTEQEPRKASEVLLEIESKLDTILSTIRANDLNIKVLSNKLGEVMKSLEKLQAAPPKITVEAVQTPAPNQAAAIFGQVPTTDPGRAIPIKAESTLPADDSPQGFRRTSRPESYAGDVYLKRDGVPPPAAPSFLFMQQQQGKPPPGRSGNDIPVTQTPPPKTKKAAEAPVAQFPAQPPAHKPATDAPTHGIIPVEQRVVDKNGKSVFLADVEIVDTNSGEQVSKSRTNGTGKWMAALPIGIYQVTIKKLESLTREKVESVQSIEVDGSQSPLKLPMVIIK
jgi:hypothetical protein